MDLDDLLRRLKPVLGEEADEIWRSLQVADPGTRRILEAGIRLRAERLLGLSFRDGDALLEPIPADLSGGPFPLGQVFYGQRPLHGFALRPEELIQHTALFGRSGAGKTNVALLLLLRFAKQGIPFLVFDWKKNYRDLLPQPAFRKLVVYTVGRDAAPYFFNPLIPPAGVEPKEWLKKLTEIMQHAYFLGEGVAFVLQEVLDRLYRDFGVYESPGSWPTFRDLQTFLRSRPVKGREASWMESTLRSVGVLNFGAMDWVLNSGAHLPLEHLLLQQAVLELDALTNSDKTFLIEALLLWIHHHRMHEPGREQLKHVLLIEEAHHVLLKKKQELTGAEAVTDVILREVREFGEAIVLLDQLPSLISRPALENTYTTICLNLKEKGDVTAAAKAMLLEPDEARHLGRLPVGWGIVKLQARWPRPFLVRFPLFDIRKGVVSEREVHERWVASLDVQEGARMMKQGVDALVRQARETFPEADWSWAEGLPRLMEGPRRPAKRTRGGRPAGSGMPAEDERRVLQRGESEGASQKIADWIASPETQSFLKDIVDHPASPVTERYRRLGHHPERGTALVQKLEGKGLLQAVTVRTPEGTLRLLDLTDEGRGVLGLPPATERYGGVEHRYWVERIADELEQAGWQVGREAPIGQGKAVDLLAAKAGRKVAIEVETGKSDWRSNVRKCDDAGLAEVVVAFTRARGTLAARGDPAMRQPSGSMVRIVSAWKVAGALVLGSHLVPDSATRRQGSAYPGGRAQDSGDSSAG